MELPCRGPFCGSVTWRAAVTDPSAAQSPVSWWRDSIWTPELTDLAKHPTHPIAISKAFAVARCRRVSTRQRANRHQRGGHRPPPPGAARTIRATISHCPKGRFILGLGSGERENCVPYGFDFERSVSRFQESIEVIRLLWSSEGPVDFQGKFYRLQHARLDAEPFEGRLPPIWIGANGPRMLGDRGEIRGWLVAGHRRSRGIRFRARRRPAGCREEGEPRSDGHRAGQDDRMPAR